MSWDHRRKLITNPEICERVKWSENDICRLVCLYKKFPCLWKKDDHSYMDNSSRHNAYSKIHQGMEMSHATFTEVMIKIREVRRIYVTELKKILKANYSGRKYYEPRQKWFFTLHNFLCEYLDFDEAAELRALEDSASSSYQEDDDDEDIAEVYDSEFVDSDTLSQSDHNPSPIFESSKAEGCRKSPQRITRDFSEAGTSTAGHFHPQKNSNCYQFKKTDSHASRVKPCPKKHESFASSEICCKYSRPRKSTSVTIICDKKRDYSCPRDETDQNVDWKGSTWIDKKPSTLSCPKSSSIERFDSNGSLNASRGKTPDEFDVFAKSVACQLRKMDMESAVMAQNHIQNILTDQRLHKTQPIRPEISRTQDPVPVHELPSTQGSVIEPVGSTSRRRPQGSKNSRKNVLRILKPPSRGLGRGVIANQLYVPNLLSEKKIKGLPK